MLHRLCYIAGSLVFLAHYLFFSNLAISECFKVQILISFIEIIFIPTFKPVPILSTFEIVCSNEVGSVNGSLSMIFKVQFAKCLRISVTKIPGTHVGLL